MRDVKIIRDAVHGDMELTADIEVPVLDTPEMQRLRGIKQLGTASLVYPSATHTRFEHSLGSCHMAKCILAAVRRTCGRVLTAEEEAGAALASLIHDVTHIPFGHTFEDERRIFERHDSPDRTRYFLNSGVMADRLRRLGLAEEMVGILIDKSPGNRCLHEIVGGTVCADLLDYLARDAICCGFSQRYDERLFRYFIIEDRHLVMNVEKAGLIRSDAISEIINLLRLRYTLSERVYFHHTKIASGAMLSKAVELAVNEGLKIETLCSLKDETLVSHLRTAHAGNRHLQTVLDRIERRLLYKRCYVLLRDRIGVDTQRELIERYHFDRKAREADEARIARAIGAEPEDVIIYCPSAEMQLKEADIRVKVDSGPPRILADLQLPEVSVLLDKQRDLWRFYLLLAREHAELAGRAVGAAEEIFGQDNQIDLVRRGRIP